MGEWGGRKGSLEVRNCCRVTPDESRLRRDRFLRPVRLSFKLIDARRALGFAETAMPAQGALPPVHRAQETELAAGGGERLAALPVSQGTPLPATAHGSRLPAGAILRRRPRDQDLQRLLHTLPSLRRSHLRYLSVTVPPTGGRGTPRIQESAAHPIYLDVVDDEATKSPRHSPTAMLALIFRFPSFPAFSPSFSFCFFTLLSRVRDSSY